MLKHSTSILSQRDAILEHPPVLAEAISCSSISREHESGSEEAKKLLTDSYQGAIEFLFELGTWLFYIDENVQSTQNIIESVVKEAILQNYDRSKAIACLTEDALGDTMEWLSQMVESPTWRRTIYELAQHPRNEDCPFLSLSMPCIAVKDTYIRELISVPLAWNTFEIFLKCIAYVLQPLLTSGDLVIENSLLHSVAFLQPRGQGDNLTSSTIDATSLLSDDYLQDSHFDLQHSSSRQDPAFVRRMLYHFLEMGCHNEHGYLIIQSILQCLASRTTSCLARHLSWLLEAEACRRNRDVSRYNVYMCGARDYPDCMESMRQILKHQELLPDNITHLHEEYRKEVPPPVQLLRQPLFIALLADVLFVNSDRLLTEQQEQYAYLYSYTAMTVEALEPGTDRRLSSDVSQVEPAKQEVLRASRICRQWNNVSGSGISLRAFRDLPVLMASLHCRPVSFGVLRFVRVAFSAKRVDFELHLDTMKPYCIVVNELAEVNHHLHSALLAFISDLLASSVDSMEDLSQLEYKRMIVGLLVHLLACGHVVPVINTMYRLFTKNHVDVSIARYFVTEVLKIAAPPYDITFMKALHPLVVHQDISDGLKVGQDREIVNEFLDYYQQHEHDVFGDCGEKNNDEMSD